MFSENNKVESKRGCIGTFLHYNVCDRIYELLPLNKNHSTCSLCNTSYCNVKWLDPVSGVILDNCNKLLIFFIILIIINQHHLPFPALDFHIKVYT